MRAWLASTGPAPLWLLAAVAVALHGATAQAYGLKLLAIAGCYALAVLGYQFVFGRIGALSLAQGAFFGLGAYASALLALNLGWDFARSFPAAIALAVVLAAGVGSIVLRLGSHYFALATLAVAELLRIFAIEWVSLTGGGNGLPGVPGFRIGDLAIGAGWPATLFVWAWAALGLFLAANYAASLYGDGSRLLRAHSLAAESVGIGEANRRLAAFMLSAAFGAAGGALYVHVLGVVSPESLQFDVMVLILCMTVIGGRNAVAGAVLGALLLVHMPEWFRAFEGWALFVYGAGLLVCIIAAPEGIAGTVESLWRRLFGAPRITVQPVAAPKAEAAGAPGTDAPVLIAENLGIAFGGNRALTGASLELRPGEIVGLIGPNGSGKTTLLNLLSGVYRPDTGQIRLADTDITALPAWRRARLGIARSFQHAALADDMTALDNVAVAANAAWSRSARLADILRLGRDRRHASARQRAMAALVSVGAGLTATKRAADLGAAERQRVELARALAADPKVLLLDEPAAGLSEIEMHALQRLLRQVAARGIGIVVVDHGMPFLLPLADRVVCLDAGTVLASGAPREVAADPAVRAAYLGSASLQGAGG